MCTLFRFRVSPVCVAFLSLIVYIIVTIFIYRLEFNFYPVTVTSYSPVVTNNVYSLSVLIDAGIDNINLTAREKDCIEDPLQDDCELSLTAFPEEPLTLASARFCDVMQTTRLPNNNEVHCHQDPTCRKCRESDWVRNTNLRRAFDRYKKTRKLRLQEWFPFPGKSKPRRRSIIVSAVNFGQLYLFLNWACSCLANNIFDPTQYIWIIPTDNETFQILNKLGFHAEPLEWKDESIWISDKYEGQAMAASHGSINNILAHATSFALQLGYHTLMMDVDTVFLGNPFPFLESAIKRRDLLGMYSPRQDNSHQEVKNSTPKLRKLVLNQAPERSTNMESFAAALSVPADRV